MLLKEIRILSGIHPTNNQKKVIAKIIASPSPKVAGEEISGDENMIAARNILMKLGVITVSSGAVELTDKGNQIAQDEGIADESGQLTDVGNALVFGQEGEQSQPNQTMPNEPPMGGMPPTEEPSLGLESFSLLRELIKG